VIFLFFGLGALRGLSLSLYGVSAQLARVPRARRALPALALGAALVGLCAWRLACVRVGPDPDTDAYGHYVIARQLLETPLLYKIHWVWLPLYHAVLALPVWLGASLDHIRSLNALAAALPSLLLLWALGARPRGTRLLDAGLPLIAALLTATSPLIMQLGTTGQMEIFFCVLLMLTVALLSRERFALAAPLLCALVLTRYEGWAVAALVAALLSAQHVRGRSKLGAGTLACVLLPALSVLSWAALRRLGDEPWFGFILDNQAFAERVLIENPDTHGALGGLARYTVSVPYRAFGASAALALIGLGRTWREDGVWFVAPGLGVVGFLTLSSLSRSQLGLDRHFLSVLPFAAVWIAHGMARLAGVVERAQGGRGSRLSQRAALLLCTTVGIGAALRLDASLSLWWNTTRTALQQPRAVAHFLRVTPTSSIIVCDDASVEVLSGLHPARFVRAHLDDRTASRIIEWSRTRDVYIVDRARNLGALLQAGPASYGAVDGPPDAFVAIHVRAATGRTTRVDG
jgi:hypothetical protein